MQDKEGDAGAMQISGQVKSITLQMSWPNSQELAKQKRYPARRPFFCFKLSSSLFIALARSRNEFSCRS
jgi:hypothetical protein